jgi:NAD-dependent deacetylase
MLDPDQKAMLAAFGQSAGRITVLTGAGISAESGIPTFRGPEGYWTVGSKEYHPQELATQAAFRHMPDEVWNWYLYRRSVCRRAEPNPGHLALATMEGRFGERFILITQNVDGLHLRAGNSLDRTYQIHGNVDYMRCAAACTTETFPLPPAIPAKAKGDTLNEAERALLRCPRCGSRSRPHVLWFDEYYDEDYFYYHSSLKAAAETDLLVVVGTSGATNLPNQVVMRVFRGGGTIIDINITENPFTPLATNSNQGFYLPQPSSIALPALLSAFE